MMNDERETLAPQRKKNNDDLPTQALGPGAGRQLYPSRSHHKPAVRN